MNSGLVDAIGTDAIYVPNKENFLNPGSCRLIWGILFHDRPRLIVDLKNGHKGMTNKTIRRIATTHFVLIPLMVAVSGQANATQHKKIVNGKEVVVHSSPIPVILHRLVPPQHGRHVTQKEVAKGQVPQPRVVAPARKRP